MEVTTVYTIMSSLQAREACSEMGLQMSLDSIHMEAKQETEDSVNLAESPKHKLNAYTYAVAQELESIPQEQLTPDERLQVKMLIMESNELAKQEDRDETDPEFTDVLNDLHNTFDPIKQRHLSISEREQVLGRFEILLGEIRTFLNRKFYESSETERQYSQEFLLLKTFEEWYSSWLSKKMRMSDSAFKQKLYSLRTLQIQSQLENLECMVRPILTRPGDTKGPSQTQISTEDANARKKTCTDPRTELEDIARLVQKQLEIIPAQMIEPAEKEQIQRTLRSAYELLEMSKGQATSPSVFQARTKKLKSVFAPLQRRYSESAKRMLVVEEFQDLLKEMDEYSDPSEDSMSSGDQHPKGSEHTKSLKSWYSNWLEKKLSTPDSVVDTKLYELRTLELQSKLEELQCHLRPYPLLSVDSHKRKSAQLRQRRGRERLSESFAGINRQSAPPFAHLPQSPRGSLRRGMSLIDSSPLSPRRAIRHLSSNLFETLKEDELDTKLEVREQGQIPPKKSFDAVDSVSQETQKELRQEINFSQPALKLSETAHEVLDLTSEQPISLSTPQTLLPSLSHEVSPEGQREQDGKSGTECDGTQDPAGKKNVWMDQNADGEGSPSQSARGTGRSESCNGKTLDGERRETYEPGSIKDAETVRNHEKLLTNGKPSIFAVNGTAQIEHRPPPYTPPPSPVVTSRGESWGQGKYDKLKDHDSPVVYNVQPTDFCDKNGSLQDNKSRVEATSGKGVTEHKTEQQRVSSSAPNKTGEDGEISMLRIIQSMGEHVHVNRFLCETEQRSQNDNANTNTDEDKNGPRSDAEASQNKKIYSASEKFPSATPTPPPSPTMLAGKTTASDARNTQNLRSTSFFDFRLQESERQSVNSLTAEAMNHAFCSPIPIQDSPARDTILDQKELQEFRRNEAVGGDEMKGLEKMSRQKEQLGTELTNKAEETVNLLAISMRGTSPSSLPTKILKARDGLRQRDTKSMDVDLNHEEQPELLAIERTASNIVKTVMDNAVLEIMKGVEGETVHPGECTERNRAKFESEGVIEKESVQTGQPLDGEYNLGEEIETVHLTETNKLSSVFSPATKDINTPFMDALAGAEPGKKRLRKVRFDEAFGSSNNLSSKNSMPSTVEKQKPTAETIRRTKDASKVQGGTDGGMMDSVLPNRKNLSEASAERSSVEVAKKDGSETMLISENSHDKKSSDENSLVVHKQAQNSHCKITEEESMEKVETSVTPLEKVVTISEVSVLCEDFKKLVKDFKNESDSVVYPEISIYRFLMQTSLEWYSYWIVHFRMLLQKSLSPNELVQIKNTIENRSKAMKSTCNYLLERLRKRTTSVKNADIKCEPSENLFHREKVRRGLENYVSQWLTSITNRTTVFDDPKDLYEVVVTLEKTEDWLQNEGRHLSRETYLQWLDQLKLLKSATAASSAQLQDAVDRFRAEIQAMKLKSTKLVESEGSTEDMKVFESRIQFYEDWLDSHSRGQGSPDFPGSLSSKLTDNLLKKRELREKLDKLEQQERPHTAQLEKEIRILHVKLDVYHTWLNIPRIPASFEWAVDNPRRMIRTINEQRITMEKELYAFTEKFTGKRSQQMQSMRKLPYLPSN
ncbi:unnamed protein product [Calicophoron daubneyi]|uniref:Uncharacterized protein n=1 Tax=Calicophoron daubneyi TaxID=300641 RepID=A0AAV2TGN8_CALDB